MYQCFHVCILALIYSDAVVIEYEDWGSGGFGEIEIRNPPKEGEASMRHMTPAYLEEQG